jgi:hypothetical protein
MTQAIDIKTLVPAHAAYDTELVTRMGLAVVKQWGALSTETKALIREQAIAVQLDGHASTDAASRIDAFLQSNSGK